MPSPFKQRAKALTALFARGGIDGLVVTHPPNWQYLTGFTGDAGVLVVRPRGLTLITDGRFTTQAHQEAGSLRLVLQKGSLMASAGEFLRTSGLGRVGYDPGQLTVSQLRQMRSASGTRTRWIQASGLVESLRNRKDASEIARMRQSALLAGEVLTSTLKILKPGVQEAEIGAEIEYQMRKRGASGPAFESIVAFGERSALPHARPTAKRLRKNELVVLDLGAILGHYCSDITRTVYVGKAPKQVKEWYKAVLEAQMAAIEAARSGAACGEVDAAARGTLANYKLDRYFVHSTGHGLGLEVHEDPRVARGQKAVLGPGTVITIEPGVYVPGVGGIRIEDDVAVHVDRSEILTRAPREFMEL